MDKRFIAFMILSVMVLMANAWLMRWLQPPPPPAAQQVAEKADENPAERPQEGENPREPAGDEPAVGKADQRAEKAEPAALPKERPAADEVPRQHVTLGSIDPDSGYRMLVTLVNSGAAVERVELSSQRYLDQEDRSGYVGHMDLAPAPDRRPGALVQVVGPGTPAAAAGVQPGDIISAVNGEAIDDADGFEIALGRTEPGSQFTLAIERNGQAMELSGTLRRRPMDVIRPQQSKLLGPFDPLSFLLTMDSIDSKRIAKGEEELPGLAMRTANWQVLPRNDPDEVAFQYDLADYGLSVVKKFRLAKLDPADGDDPSAAAYHLQFDIEVRNVGDEPRKVAYRLEGPTGLPLEGAWYAYKISPNWRGGAGMRDVVVGFLRDGRTKYGLVSAYTIAEEKNVSPWQDEPLKYIGVDAQYFASALLPPEDAGDVDYAEAMPIRVGEVPEDRSKLNRTNVSFRLTSKVETVAPQGKAAVHAYKIFAGPKKPSLLANYGLSKLVYYGWFGSVAQIMVAILHTFYRFIPNYGIAIIMLTVLVRSLLFPVSRRQALNAQKMQELQPEIKRIQEKYKGNLEARSKAQQELFRKHSYNPLSGCLPLFLQLPIFMGLYRALAVDVELRGAPLLSSSIRWCSNLAAPDMLWHWQPYLPAFLAGPSGWLGPYFNVLPCITIALFLWQQKMFMPPPADEQAAMQQKMMQYMMIFICVMFFKVASGLCLYFIASSLWGIAERKLLPKFTPPTGGSPPSAPGRAAATRGGPGGNGAADTRKKHRGRA
ncbi:MAG: YidC/Oxa1 family insertase periplasmic-domain containing protein [Planctomycetia bacterium]|nr:YidC/Oxa1 family insertase periplasmic-domain containing protein [Planctomycetia bacterium]